MIHLFYLYEGSFSRRKWHRIHLRLAVLLLIALHAIVRGYKRPPDIVFINLSNHPAHDDHQLRSRTHGTVATKCCRFCTFRSFIECKCDDRRRKKKKDGHKKSRNETKQKRKNKKRQNPSNTSPYLKQKNDQTLNCVRTNESLPA